MISTILFDYAGVITVKDPGFLWYSENVSDFQENKSVYDALGHQVDIGELTKDEFVAEVSKATGIDEDKIWSGIKEKTVIDKELVFLIKELKKHYKIGLISNYVSEWLVQILDENDLNDLFDVVVVSSDEKIVKPDKRLFDITLGKLGSNYEESLFIDDRESNVIGATNIGIKSIQFTSYKNLVDELIAFGVIGQ